MSEKTPLMVGSTEKNVIIDHREGVFAAALRDDATAIEACSDEALRYRASNGVGVAHVRDARVKKKIECVRKLIKHKQPLLKRM